MEGDDKREEGLALLVIMVLAVLSLASLLVAFSYYCYISNKVAKHLKSLSSSKNSFSFVFPLPSLLSSDLHQLLRCCFLLKEGKNEEREKAGRGSSAVSGGEAPVVVSERGVLVFTYKQLHAATGGFGKANVVGHGSFGSVYRGVMPDGRKIAVKLMDLPGKQGEEEFKMEVALLSYTYPAPHPPPPPPPKPPPSIFSCF